MKTRNHPFCVVNDRTVGTVRAGHPWVFGTDVLSVSGEIENGDIVDVVSRRGNRYLGSGFYNANSKMRIRVFSNNASDTYDDTFWERRVRYAVAYRKTVLHTKEDFACTRLIFGDADRFPGLTVDRFGPVLVAQVLSLGMERIKNTVFSALVRVLREEGETVTSLYERNDVAVRELEGLEPRCGFWCGEGLEPGNGIVEITENGIRYTVDYITGQKTGFFLDQKYNRLAAARLAKGRRVLDCFTHTGAFALNCIAAGAAHVTAVDISEDAIRMTRENAELNGFSPDVIDYRADDVFRLLTELREAGRKDYDYIILDPPAFTKSAETVDSAFRGYREINREAMRLLPRGGYLATCSCSHFMSAEQFERMLREAAYDAGVNLRQIECRRQAPDHPILFGVPQTEYLKFYLFQVV